MPEKALGPAPPSCSSSVSKSMRGNVGKDTKPEIELRKIIREMGHLGYRLHWKNVPGHPDISFPGRKLAIFLNGCFWHRCPKCKLKLPKSHTSFWEKKFRKNVERDKKNVKLLEKKGWITKIIWECEIKKDVLRVVASIDQALAKRHWRKN